MSVLLLIALVGGKLHTFSAPVPMSQCEELGRYYAAELEAKRGVSAVEWSCHEPKLLSRTH